MDEIVEEYRLYRYAAKIAAESKKNKRNIVREGLEEDLEFDEKFLQTIWNEQKLEGELTTENGSRVEVVSKGIWNSSAGPDFKNATILMNGKLYAGDIEIHRKRSDWYRHGHENDQRYGNVILHVVWENDMPEIKGRMEVLVIRRHMNEDWRRLLWELEESRYAYADKMGKGECALRWAMTEDGKVRSLLEAAGLARFRGKINGIKREIEDKGSARALIEGIFDVLGYKSNRRQFRQIAEALDISALKSRNMRNVEKEALIFGTANMLPDTTRCRVAVPMAGYVDELWDAWWRLGQKRTLDIKWDKSESRPYNMPWRRLAAGIELLERTDWNPDEWLRNVAMNGNSTKEMLRKIGELNNRESRFRGYTNFDREICPGADLLGKDRIAELAVNMILPFMAAIGEIEGNEKCIELARATYQSMAPMQGNRLLKEASTRFLTPPSRVRDLVKKVCQQQGLLDIYKNFCLALDNNCELCPFSCQEEIKAEEKD